MAGGIAILGAGVTGIAAARASGGVAYEAAEHPGGLCGSYSLSPGSGERQHGVAKDDAYRFEPDGGHWIFGGDADVLHLLDGLAPVEHYERRSAVYFPGERRSVTYPMQDHLECLPVDVAARARTLGFADGKTVAYDRLLATLPLDRTLEMAGLSVEAPRDPSTSVLVLNSGISIEGDLLDLGAECGVIEKSGAWFSFEGERIGQGRENVRNLLLENPDVRGRITDAVYAAKGIKRPVLAKPEEPAIEA